MKKIFAYILLLFIASNSLFAQVNADSSKKRLSAQKSSLLELQKDIDAILDIPEMKNSFYGIAFYSIDKGEYLYKKNEAKNFVPASLQKLLTTSAALEYLGEDFKYSTGLYLSGYISNTGEYYGDIVIRGSGDPTYSKYFSKDPISRINYFAEILDSLGIKSIFGNIIGDDNYFDDEYYASGWAWDDMVYPFSAQVSALSVYENKVDFKITPGEDHNSLAEYQFEPPNKYIQVINNIKTMPFSDISEISARRDARTNIIELGGKIIKDSLDKEVVNISVTIDNPTLYFLSIFKESLDKFNIRFKGALLDIDDIRQRINYSDLKLVYEDYSPPLKEIIKFVNKQSNNLTAELLLKTIAKETTGYGSFVKGTEQLTKYLSKMSIPQEKTALYDGSGLSRMNLISPEYLVKVLSYLYKAKYSDAFRASLAKPGENGTLNKRLIKSTAQNRIIAKTGSMTGVNNLSGYVFTQDSDTLAFSIMISNFTAPQSVISNIIDLICMRVAAFTRKQNENK